MSPIGTVLPQVDSISEPFWLSGADGVLRFQRCIVCDWWVHPPKPRCPRCLSTELTFQPVSGRATIWSFTVNHQRWMPDLEVPYVIAIVAFPEQEEMRMTTRLVDVDPDQIRIGQEVEVAFHAEGGLFLPYFKAVR